MKLFCDCNSEWLYNIDISHKTRRLVQTNFTQSNKILKCLCDECTMWKWYDADYENMMFDLRNMNS